MAVWKDFTGAPFPSAEVDTYLMDQVLIEGASGDRPPNKNLRIVKEADTFRAMIYNGTGWVVLATWGPQTSDPPSANGSSWIRTDLDELRWNNAGTIETALKLASAGTFSTGYELQQPAGGGALQNNAAFSGRWNIAGRTFTAQIEMATATFGFPVGTTIGSGGTIAIYPRHDANALPLPVASNKAIGRAVYYQSNGVRRCGDLMYPPGLSTPYYVIQLDNTSNAFGSDPVYSVKVGDGLLLNINYVF